MDSVNLKQAHQAPITINNQVFILGSPVVPTATLQELTRVLDNAGADTPIVIINPEAVSVPNFDQLLSNLIQNNRSKPKMNVTTFDKYMFKDYTDEQLISLVDAEIAKNPAIEPYSLYNIYLGLRARAAALYAVDSLVSERDRIWSLHIANPASPVGYDRYNEIVNVQLPQAQSYYAWVCERLSGLQVNYRDPATVSSTPTQVSETINEHGDISHEAPTNVEIETVPVTVPTVNVWGPWNCILNMQMPLSVAKEVVDSRYIALKEQQKDVTDGERIYKAVEPEVLIALGIDVYPDGVPIVYTEIGTFKRIGNSDHPVSDLSYWYPKPKVKEVI